ncbi:hypothetical protein [Campylobacter sp. MG1]|uniref:hypothetical protein n=1 Tax=Campylobacter sp. MG1 TaxID=2976332 RepID=UPI00226C69D2|nr:hypothetical protein [Campylobacter sp. MG1]
MKKYLKKYIFYNKFVLENFARGFYTSGFSIIIALAVTFVFKADFSTFAILIIVSGLVISLFCFFIGIILDNIRKDL